MESYKSHKHCEMLLHTIGVGNGPRQFLASYAIKWVLITNLVPMSRQVPTRQEPLTLATARSLQPFGHQYKVSDQKQYFLNSPVGEP